MYIDKNELDRLNQRISELTSKKRIRIVVYLKDKDGCKSVYDIVDYPRRYICTPKTNVLSRSGIDTIKHFMPRDANDWRLVELENASE